MMRRKIIKSGQEQAVASLIDRINQIRLDNFISSLRDQEKNLMMAMNDLDSALNTIKKEIIEKNRGGYKGMHGFIAEAAECGIGNARQHIVGMEAIYEWVNDNGPVDFFKGTVPIQQKFSQSKDGLSLRAILGHLGDHPDFISNGKYQVPQDFYEKIKYYLSIPESEAYKMSTSTGGFSLKQWKEVQEVVGSGMVPIEKIEPSTINYADAQAGKIEFRINDEKENISDIDNSRREASYQASKPSFSEGVKASLGAATIEGLTAFGISICNKRRSKCFGKFTQDDWCEIIKETGIGSLKGGIRGATIYIATNYINTPSAVANALVTSAFGVAEQLHLYRNNKISELQFIENSELLCVDAAVSGICALLGQVAIPVPVLGAVLGNTIGTILYQLGKDLFSDYEANLVEKYLNEINELNITLDNDFQHFIISMNEAFVSYSEIVSKICSVNVLEALDGSVTLAKRLEVKEDEILSSREEIMAYFLG